MEDLGMPGHQLEAEVMGEEVATAEDVGTGG